MSDFILEKYVMPWKIRNEGVFIDYVLYNLYGDKILTLHQLVSHSDKYSISYMKLELEDLGNLRRLNPNITLTEFFEGIEEFLIEKRYEFIDEDKSIKLKLLL